jgi:cell fate (sporulation/competence/biofilm development) regulator YlbF (YheA/YmcA/DUF963 family)
VNITCCEEISHYISRCEEISHYTSCCEEISHYISRCEEISHYISRYEEISHYISRYEKISHYISRCEEISHYISRYEEISHYISRCEEISHYMKREEQQCLSSCISVSAEMTSRCFATDVIERYLYGRLLRWQSTMCSVLQSLATANVLFVLFKFEERYIFRNVGTKSQNTYLIDTAVKASQKTVFLEH